MNDPTINRGNKLVAWLTLRPRWVKQTAVAVVVLIFIASGIKYYLEHELTRVYGWTSVSAAIHAYMKERDTQWPRSWRDLKPYLNNSFDHQLLEKYWGVGWDVDPVKLHHEAPCKDGETLYPIYSRAKHPEPTGRFCFPPESYGTMRQIELLLIERKLVQARPKSL